MASADNEKLTLLLLAGQRVAVPIEFANALRAAVHRRLQQQVLASKALGIAPQRPRLRMSAANGTAEFWIETRAKIPYTILPGDLEHE
jgi:hypothetical protein